MKHVFILNSFRNGDCNKLSNEIFKYCVNHNMDYKCVTNSKSKSTEDLVKEYANKNSIIYAVGGDGMINRVLNAIVGTGATLGYLPNGTGNDFSRVLNLYEQDVREVNVGKINDKYFINVACFGMDADTANDDRFIHSKILPENLRYPASALVHFASYKPKELEIYFKEGIYNNAIAGKFATVAVCNSRYYGGGFNIAPTADIQDNLFDVYLVDGFGHMQLLKTILKMHDGKHEGMSGVEKYMLDNITIRSRKPINANVDGEAMVSDEFNISLDNNIKVYNNLDMIKELDRVLKVDNTKKRILKR
jgi:YegS/Rv2252/BmrU family lipid kinase